MWRPQFLLTLLFSTAIFAGSSRPYEPPFYTNSRHIVELTPDLFHDFVYGSNYSTIVEFYAPWCGYCKQLRPEFEKASKRGHHFAQFGAVNCDEEKNKKFCAAQNIKGFPTLLTYRPPKTFREDRKREHQYVVQPFELERTSKSILNTMKNSVKAYTKKLNINNLPSFLNNTEFKKPRVLLLTDKQQVSQLFKILNIDFLDVLDFFYIPLIKDSAIAKVKELIPDFRDNLDLPKVIVIDSDQNMTVYEGDINKHDISEFLTAFGTPVEGEFSERHHILKGIRSGKYKNFTHYKKAKKSSKAKRQPEEVVIEKDEL
jgi:protein disulfide-isomerase A6